MINLKDACRYSNFLETIISDLGYLFSDKNNIYNITETHYKSNSNPDAANEVISNQPERRFVGKLHDMAFLYEQLVNEKLQLSLAISEAKRNNFIGYIENGVDLDLDSAIEYNKRTRHFSLYNLRPIENKKDLTEKTFGKDYKLNIEGNQVPYTYTVEKNLEVDFDKKIIANKSKKILEKADRISTLIDEFMLKRIVDFVPRYNLHDSLDDIIKDFEAEQ